MPHSAETPDEFAASRHAMVEQQLRRRGIASEAVLQAMEEVPRHLFVPETARHAAYDDSPLHIGRGQTISQPFMVARMTELLNVRPGSRILEVGTGSGYQAAVLDQLGAEVWTIERLPELAEAARQTLDRLGYDRVHVVNGDGTLGLPEQAPYDGIIVTAAAPHVPEHLTDQLAEGGRLVIPVGARDVQELRVVARTARGLETTYILDCRFVPLVGAEGYPPEESAS